MDAVEADLEGPPDAADGLDGVDVPDGVPEGGSDVIFREGVLGAPGAFTGVDMMEDWKDGLISLYLRSTTHTHTSENWYTM